ncbi:hypothetical protein H4R23_003238 [Coemansia sp. Cherry 401B]|nr:hypothetical protein H4R23_003238 [Coemansia sp. Cherry 401B]
METSNVSVNAQSATDRVDDFGLIDYESPSLEPTHIDEPDEVEEPTVEPLPSAAMSQAAATASQPPPAAESPHDNGLIDYEESDADIDVVSVSIDGDAAADVVDTNTSVDVEVTEPTDNTSVGVEVTEPADNTSVDVDVEAAESEVDIDTVEPEVDIDTIEPGIDIVEPEVDIDTVEPEVDIDTVEPDIDIVEPPAAEASAVPSARSVDGEAQAEARGAETAAGAADVLVPETWVRSDGEWMVFLGPGQRLYEATDQQLLFTITLAELIDVLQTECALGEDVDLALEFPSLGLTIDKRDHESSETSLATLYSGHAAALAVGALPVDYVNSSTYFHQHFESNAAGPSLESFLFVIHTRPKVHSALKRIMEVKEQAENAGHEQHESPVVEEHVVGEEGEEDTANGDLAEEPANGDLAEDTANGNAAEESADTAALLAAASDEDEEDDEDFVASDEEASDHVLDADAVSDDEVEVVEDDAQIVEDEEDEDGAQTRVDSENASPSHKRTKAQQVAVDDEEQEPAAKKAKSDEPTAPVAAAQ